MTYVDLLQILKDNGFYPETEIVQFENGESSVCVSWFFDDSERTTYTFDLCEGFKTTTPQTPCNYANALKEAFNKPNLEARK